MQGVLRTKFSLAGLSVWMFFLLGVWTDLMMGMLFEAECLYGDIATPVTFSFCGHFFLVHKICLMSCLLYPFFLKVFIKCSVSASWIVPACYTSIDNVACFYTEWCSDLACRYRYICVGFLYMVCQIEPSLLFLIRTSSNSVALSFCTYLSRFCRFKEMIMCGIIPFKNFL